MRNYTSKILTRREMIEKSESLRDSNQALVFTNGCFDILHPGHVDYLNFARKQGDALCVGLNSDASVKRNKGPSRPIVAEQDRAKVLSALECVDFVVLFDEDEPAELIAEILPSVLVKGEDWAHYVSGREAVEKAGGRVVLAKMVAGRSTSGIIERILKSAKGDKNDAD